MPVNVQGVRIPLGPLTGILIFKCPGTLKSHTPTGYWPTPESAGQLEAIRLLRCKLLNQKQAHQSDGADCDDPV